MKASDIREVPISQIFVPPEVEPGSITETERRMLKASIEADLNAGGRGIQDPLILLEDGDRFRLVDGCHRLQIAGELKMPKVVATVGRLPEGETMQEFVPKLRFIVGHHRQDFLPTQLGLVIDKLKSINDLTNVGVAKFLGVDSDSITNWTAILKYIQPVKDARDAGELTQKNARVFDGLTDKGQEVIWRKHRKELCDSEGASDVHQRIRDLYPPSRFAHFYRNPDRSAALLERTPKKRKTKDDLTKAKKKKLLNSYTTQRQEVEMWREKEKQYETRIEDFTPLIAACMRNKILKPFVPDEMMSDFQAFAKRYIA